MALFIIGLGVGFVTGVAVMAIAAMNIVKNSDL